MANKIYQIVTDSIITKIEKAIEDGNPLPWQKPWTADDIPVNYISQKAYRGVNLLLLETGEYLTWSQLCDLQKHRPDLKLKKGSKAHKVVFFSVQETSKEKTTKNGEIESKIVKVPFLRYYKVFKATDVEGLETRRKPTNFQHSPYESAEQIIKDYICREGVRLIYKNGDRACYNTATDTVTVPEIKQFEILSEYYSTVFHELVHSTGNAARLDRLNNFSAFGNQDYSKEELIAEMGAAMLMGHIGIDTTNSLNNSAAYLRGWLKALKDDVTLIVSASSKAQKAVDFIINTNQVGLDGM